MIDMASDSAITDGFNKDPRVQAAGVKIVNGQMSIKDVNNPQVKSILQDALKRGALTKIPKNKTGGKVRVDEGFDSVPIQQQESDPRSDNMLAVNPKTQEGLFTYNNKEKLAYNQTNDQVQVVPQNKIGTQQDPTTAYAQATNKIQGPITAASTVSQSAQQNNADLAKDQPANSIRSPNIDYNRDPNMIDNMMQHSGVLAKSPSAERAFSRAGFAETGGGIGGKHFSYGTSSIT